MNIIKRTLKSFEDEMAAAALAEEGETKMALAILKESKDQVVEDSRGQRKIGRILPSPSVSE
jgi:hypothetical protein